MHYFCVLWKCKKYKVSLTIIGLTLFMVALHRSSLLSPVVRYCVQDTQDESGHTVEQSGMSMGELENAFKIESQKIRDFFQSQNEASLPTAKHVQCHRVWEGDINAINKSRKDARRPSGKKMKDYLEETLDCTNYVRKYGFRLAAISKEELDFPLAFSLLVYRDVDQVVRLLRAIYRPHNLYCVHVDRKSNEVLQASLRMVIACLPNVLLASRATNVTWGTVTTLQPELECMRLLWKQPVKWRYFINLTGQEFPLKTNKELVHILKTFRGANDIRGTHNPDFHYRWKKFLPAPYNITVSKGSVHIVVSRGFVDYVIHSRVSRHLLKWVTPIYIPDEIFFSTLNHNPHLGVPGSYLGNIEEPFKATFVRYKLWNTPRFPHVQPCDGRWVRHICHFAPGDLPRMIVSPKLFANKFSYDYMPAAYDCLEEWYWHKVHLENSGHPPPLNLSVYATSTIVTQRYTGPVKVWN